MCNLNILLNKKKIATKEDAMKLIGFVQTVTSHSYANNSDGEGVYVKGFLIKSLEKINYLSFYDPLIRSNIILTHQRIATSGLTSDYTQPFESKEFVLAHNGIINDFLGKEGSDTWGFFNKFVSEFDKLPGEREEKIVRTIKDLLDNISGGSFSIALYDKLTDNLYYFKDSRTSIHFYRDNGMLFITTEPNNSKFLKMIGNFQEIKVKDYVIYRINTTDSLEMKKVGKIKRTETFYSSYSSGRWDWSNNVFQKEEQEKEEWEDDVIISNDAKPCSICQTITHNMVKSENYNRVCDDCLAKEEVNGIYKYSKGVGYVG